MLLFRILFVVFLGSSLVACGNNAVDEVLASIKDPASDPEADPDEDGLTNDQELNVYFTAPDIADTDGDGISDGDEVNELGFNASSNLYRFNPLIADLPTMGINFETVPDLVLRFTDSAGTNKEFSSSTGGSEIESTTKTNSGTVSLTVGIEESVKVGTESGIEAETKVSASLTGSYTNTTAETTENQKTWNDVTTDGSFASRATDGASLRIGISLENTSNLTYSLEHITLLTSYVQSDASVKPIATLSYDNTGGGFQRTSFAPGDKSNLLLFSNDNLDLGTALELLKDARNMIVQPALFELVNAEGVPIAFDEGEVDAKTAEVIIDYGVVRPQEIYNVAVLGSQGEGSLKIDTILSSILNVDYVDSDGLTEVRTIGGDADSRWIVLVTHNDGFQDSTTFYDPADASYDISSIDVFPGDQLAIVYLTDVDGDGVGIREEILNGTDPEKMDTDGDGLTDDVEIRSTILVNAINIKDPNRYPAIVRSNPILADADGDLLTDKEEIERGLDPNNADTDGDGIGDKLDTFNGQIPIAADFVITPQGGSSITLAGLATPQAGTRVTSVTVSWGDSSADDFVTSTTSVPLSVNFQHTYPVQASGSMTYDVTITMQSTDDDSVNPVIVTVTHIGSFQLFSEKTLSEFNSIAGWSAEKHIRTLADMDNDGDLDLIGFGNDGVGVKAWDETNSVFNDSFAFATIGSTWLTGLYGADVGGGSWDKNRHPRYLVDYDADGLTDVVGIGEGAVVWSKNCGDGTLKAAAACGNVGVSTASEQLSNGFSANTGWDPALHFRAMADVDGNGLIDLVGAGAGAVFVLRNLGSSATELVTMDQNAVQTLEQSYGTAFTSGDAGNNNTNSFRMLADINGDGRADMVLSGGSRIIYTLGQNDGTFSPIGEICTSSEPCFTPAQGWVPDKHLIFLEDMNNDSLPDLVGFGSSAVYVSLNASTVSSVNYGPFKVWSSGYTYNQGWRVGQHLRYLADVNGDGYKDIVGFTGSAVASLNLLPKGQQGFSSAVAILSANISLGSNWETVVTTQELNPAYPLYSSSPTIDVDVPYYNNRLAGDFNNDGYADVIGFGNAGVVAQRSPVIVQPSEQ